MNAVLPLGSTKDGVAFVHSSDLLNSMESLAVGKKLTALD